MRSFAFLRGIASSVLAGMRRAGFVGSGGACDYNEGGRSYNSERTDAGLEVGQVQHGYALQDAQCVRHEPEQPDNDAERVEALLRTLTSTQVRDRCPCCMSGHENDGEHARGRVHAEGCIASALGHERHDGSAGGIEREAGPEKYEITFGKRMTALVKHADGVEHERKADGCRS